MKVQNVIGSGNKDPSMLLYRRDKVSDSPKNNQTKNKNHPSDGIWVLVDPFIFMSLLRKL